MITLYNVRPKGHNIGNDAISVALRDQVYKAFGRVVNIIDIPATALYESHSKAGLSSKTVYEINRVGDGVIVGGGNLYENDEIDISKIALEALEVPLMLFSNSIGRVYNREKKLVPRTDVIPDEKLKILHDYADLSLTRDTATLKHVKKIGSENSIFGGCPTIFLGKNYDYSQWLPKSEDVGVLISIRTPSLINLPQKYQNSLTAELVDTVNSLKERGYQRVRLLCNDSRDCEYASYFRDLCGVDFVYTSNIFDYLSLLSKAKLIISFRLHATLPALSFNTPVINISYDERAESLIEDIGLGKWDIKYINEEKLSDSIMDRVERLEDLKTIVAKASEKWNEIEKIQSDAFLKFEKLVRNNMIKRGIIKK